MVSKKELREHVGKLISKHCERLELPEIPFEIVRKAPDDDVPSTARAYTKASFSGGTWGETSFAIFFMEDVLMKEFDRDPQFIEDLVVHELMHVRCPEPGEGHSDTYRTAMMLYGYHPFSCGKEWRGGFDDVVIKSVRAAAKRAIARAAMA